MNERGITSRYLSERMGITLSGVNQHLTGNPSLKVLKQIAEILEVPVWQLLVDPAEILPKEPTVQITCPHCGKSIAVEVNVK